ncbi:MAG TPA: glycosyltransferase family A protein, partial [Myxococcaceae bacterium]|nr:glycosyltransferase family A protein [Myxococcaceae bacterium]
PGLLSVVVWAGSPGRPGLLDETLFSLACQEQHPLELVLALGPEARPSAEATRELLERYRRLGGFQLQLVEGDAPGLLDEALRRTRGQYVAFLEAGGVVYPAHYVRLVAALQRGEEAWAVARAFRATCRPGRPGEVPFIESKCPFPLGEHLETTHLLQEPELLQALVIDRFRVEPLPLAPVSPEEGLAPLPLRLAALFEPIFLAEGIATCEVRSFPVEGPPAAREPPSLQVLGSLSSLEARLSRAKAEGASTRALRYRLVDGLDARVRKRLPWLYSALRSAARRLR